MYVTFVLLSLIHYVNSSAQRAARTSRSIAGLAVFVAAVLFPVSSQSLPVEAVAPINNRDYGQAVRKIVRGARKSLAIMLYQTRFYEEYPDTLTNYLLRDLIDARNRGVDVKLILDTGTWDPSQKNEYNADFMDRLTTSGIAIWEDAPDEVSHEKVICADDEVSVVSSNNWTFYSLDKNNEVAVVVFSAAVNAYFRGYFDERCARGRQRCAAAPVAQLPGPAGSGLNSSDFPDLKKLPAQDIAPAANRLFYPVVHDALLHAVKSIDVVQKSFTTYEARPDRNIKGLPGEPASETNVLAADLIGAARRGVKVRVVLDRGQNEDEKNGDTAELLQKNGVEVYGDDPAVQTHAKLVVIDGDRAVVGSTNWTYAAIEEGNEASILIRSQEVNKVYKDYVETLMRSAAPYQAQANSIWGAPSNSH